MASTLVRRARVVASAAPSRAERLVAAVNAMPIETVRERIESARNMTSAEIVERQRFERRERAERAAAALRAL